MKLTPDEQAEMTQQLKEIISETKADTAKIENLMQRLRDKRVHELISVTVIEHYDPTSTRFSPAHTWRTTNTHFALNRATSGLQNNAELIHVTINDGQNIYDVRRA